MTEGWNPFCERQSVGRRRSRPRCWWAAWTKTSMSGMGTAAARRSAQRWLPYSYSFQVRDLLEEKEHSSADAKQPPHTLSQLHFRRGRHTMVIPFGGSHAKDYRLDFS
jgi:hypothetical protein